MIMERVRQIALLGPESTGKSTLARDLADHFDTVDVQEYAREAFDWGDPDLEVTPEDFEEMAAGHARWIDNAISRANRLLFLDTDFITTEIWSEIYFHACPASIRRRAREQDIALYLLLDVDVPWVDDGVRTWEHLREWHFSRIHSEIRGRGLPYEIISGGWEERFHRAVAAVERRVLMDGRQPAPAPEHPGT